ncbi:hypothetical protein [Rhodococcus sp. ARC_M6]|nr:hypothetical protein [Rhodococcus sp. ARC_M6]MCJ0906147.1 hypothetical protein [Rhodococcus sp. ARC_M6]
MPTRRETSVTVFRDQLTARTDIATAPQSARPSQFADGVSDRDRVHV